MRPEPRKGGRSREKAAGAAKRRPEPRKGGRSREKAAGAAKAARAAKAGAAKAPVANLFLTFSEVNGDARQEGGDAFIFNFRFREPF